MSIKRVCLTGGSIVGLITALSFIGYVENTYTINAEVKNIEEDGTIELTDKVGYKWSYTDVENTYAEGESVILTMDTNTTNNRQDDYIISIKR